MGPRLVLTDWLEERGDGRATWLRWSSAVLPGLVAKALTLPRPRRITLVCPWTPDDWPAVVSRLVAPAGLRQVPCHFLRPVAASRRHHPLPSTRPTTQQPRTCGPDPRQCSLTAAGHPASSSKSANSGIALKSRDSDMVRAGVT